MIQRSSILLYLATSETYPRLEHFCTFSKEIHVCYQVLSYQMNGKVQVKLYHSCVQRLSRNLSVLQQKKATFFIPTEDQNGQAY